MAKSNSGIEVRLLNALALGTTIIMDQVHWLLIILVVDMRCKVVVKALLVEVLPRLGVSLLLLSYKLLGRFISEIQVLDVDWFCFKSYAVHVDHNSVFII